MEKFIVANWKMNGSNTFVNDFLPIIKPSLSSTLNKVILCPPFPYLESVRVALAGTPTLLGAQNCHTASHGAYTGEVSATMLADLGCSAVIIGHSERRTLFAEDDALIKSKVSAVHAAGMRAIVCVGESLYVRESGNAIETVTRQFQASLPPSVTAHNTIIAYEPVWAIGTGITPIPEEIIEMHQALYTTSKIVLPLLYGGSVTDLNIEEIFSLPHVDGVLVGGSSLKVAPFQKIIEAKP